VQELPSVRCRVAFVDSEHDGSLSARQRLVDFEDLTRCKFTPHLVFQREADLRSEHTWAMPPPVSPSRQFVSVPSAVDAGCALELSSGRWPALELLEVRSLGVPLGLGCFAAAHLPAGLALCEYTGVVMCDAPRSALEGDDYAFNLPVCDPDVVITARTTGGIARTINHSEQPNAELRTVTSPTYFGSDDV